MFTLPTVDSNVTTAIAAAGGAILIKIVEKWLSRRNETRTEAERIRAELREEVNRYREDNIRLEKEINEWKTKYWNKKRMHESDELRIEELESDVHDGASRIDTLTNTLRSLQDDVNRLKDE